MTALGPITVSRVSVTGGAGGGGHPADARLGLDGLLTTQATRRVCRTGGPRSFAHAEMLPTERCGWHASDERIRRACHAEAEHSAAWRADPIRSDFGLVCGGVLVSPPREPVYCPQVVSLVQAGTFAGVRP